MPEHHHHHRHHSSHRSLNGKNFVILPVVFSVLILGICAAVIGPTILKFYNMADLFISDVKLDYSDNYRNIYVPTSEGLEESSETSETSSEPKKPLSSKTVPITSIEYPRYSDQFGELIIEDCGIKVPLFFGDGNLQLNNGVGIYTGSFIPGYGRPILVAGHNVTYFNGLKYAKEGQIVLATNDLGNNIAKEIAAGVVAGVGAQLPYDQGVAEAKLAALALLGEACPAYVAVPAQPVSHDNVMDGYFAVYHVEAPDWLKEAYKE